MKGPQILVVDDEPGIRQSLTGVLEDEGYSAEAVETAEDCLATLERLVRQEGLCVTTPPRLAPVRLRDHATAPFSEIRDGKGCWILTADVTHPEVLHRLEPFLGRPDQLRYVFGRTEVIFSQPNPAGTVEVSLRELPATPPAAN
jgi:CheY-like chemotaxis protein